MKLARVTVFAFLFVASGCSGQGAPPTGHAAAPAQIAGPSEAKHRAPYSARRASSDPTHVWLHYDYMVFPNGLDLRGIEPYCSNPSYTCVFPPGFSTAPDKQQIDKVMMAFRHQHLTLHIDPHHTEIPGLYAILDDLDGNNWDSSPPCMGPSSAKFSDLKAQYFHPKGNRPWHYTIVGFVLDSLEGEFDNASCNGVEGVAELPGFDFELGFGTRYIIGLGFGPPQNVFGGILMHELGHNLGLQHGGDEDLNWKPNYLSVMNYRFQFGIPQAKRRGSKDPHGDDRVDYSPTALATLDENHLNENLGIGAGTKDISYYWDFFGSQDCIDLYPSPAVPAATTGPVDWNCDGTLESDIADDLISTTDQYVPLTTLHGFNDWAEVKTILSQSPSRLRPKRHVDPGPQLSSRQVGVRYHPEPVEE